MSVFDADRFRSELEKEVMDAAREEIEEKGVEIDCPHCGKPITVFPGSNICPHCQNDINVNLDL